MLRPANAVANVYLCREPVDFRKGLHALAVLVEGQLKLDPFSSGLFVFRNRRGSGVKLLYWERNGFCLWHKKLERDRFHWPRTEEAVITMTGQMLNWLLDGYDITRLKPHAALCYSSLL
ncbi:MAG: IS66 family insertion sequence element accessory protein TnpB [Gammaproteobacteria bacterium]